MTTLAKTVILRFKVSDLLANDGGSVKDVTKQFVFGTTEADWADQTAYLTKHGITDNHDGTYTLTSGADDFQYMIQTGNKGTWSTANVDVTAPEPVVVDPHLSGNELLLNWDFEADKADNANSFVDLNTITDWTNEGTSQPMQIQHENFGFVTGFAEGEEQWLDTSASPGNIHIGQNFDLAEGATAKLSVSVAAEDIKYFNGWTTDIYQPDANDHLLFLVNDEVMLDISLANYTDANGTVDWNHFKEFTIDVTGRAGTDHFEIQTTGMDQPIDAGDGVIHGYAGFAVDHVSFQEWII
jgi:hypothetical protein